MSEAEPQAAGRRLLRDGAHLAALSAFAIAQPLFSLLGDNAEFFAARDVPALDIVVFALVVTLVPPLLMLAVERLVGLLDRRAERLLHLAFVALLVGLLAIQALMRVATLPTGPLLVVTAVVAVAAAVAYARVRVVRSFLTVLSPAPLLFLFVFLVVSPVSALVLPASEAAAPSSAAARSAAPVVLLIMDELPLTDLLDADGRVDAIRYPSFAELAGTSTWYRNATTVYDSTTHAVPAILTGRMPRKGQLPTLRDHPDNLFTLLGARGRTNVSEEATSLCPERLCPVARAGGFVQRMRALASDVGLVYAHEVLPAALARRLPSTSETWGGFAGDGEDIGLAAAARPKKLGFYLNRGRGGRMEQWIRSIAPSRAPTLDVKHLMLPHGPLLYLPSGAVYRRGAREPIASLTTEATWGERFVIDQIHQRHLLQLGYADLLLGRVIARLRAARLWDRALVVVTADHGIAFAAGGERRQLTPRNIEEIAPVPLFVKEPRQRQGRTSDAWVTSIDVLPTMAKILGLRIPWSVDGRPADSAEVAGRRSVTMLTHDLSGTVTVDTRRFAARVRAIHARTQRLFGSGADVPGLYGLGPNRRLVGRALDELHVAPRRADGPRGTLDRPERLRAVRRATGLVPAHVTGAVHGDPPGARHDLAIAVNGRVVAVSRSVYVDGDPTQRISAIVPEQALREGANDVRVFTVEARGGRLRLTEIVGT